MYVTFLCSFFFLLLYIYTLGNMGHWAIMLNFTHHNVKNPIIIIIIKNYYMF